MWGQAGLPPADAAMADDGAGRPAQALGQSPGAHVAARPGAPLAFWEATGLFAAASELPDEKPHQLQLPPLSPGMSTLEPSQQR